MNNMSKVVAALMVATSYSVVANDNCVMQYSVNTESVAVSEKGHIDAKMHNGNNNTKRCVVSFRAKVKNAWYNAHGQSTWDGVSSYEQTCQQAVKNAEKALAETIAPSVITTESLMVCSDAPHLQEKPTVVGATGNYSQFRSHPEKPGIFWYNGTHCAWTLDTRFSESNLRTYQAIICQTSPGIWAVIDVF